MESALINELFNQDFITMFNSPSNKFYFEETKKDGQGKCFFETQAPTIKIKAKDQAPIIWALKNKKCAEGAFAKISQNGQTSLHILEKKSGLGKEEFLKVLEQFKGMYLSALSVMSLLNLEQPKEIFVYIAYNVDKINNPNLNPNNPAASKAMPGSPERAIWHHEIVKLHYGLKAKLVKGQRANGDYDFGVV